jgi:exopolyphosphatase/guanosine-5'-triphosphate,3'-diphosphate pyrophosphatase
MRTASIDIGTNTIRLLICEQKGAGELKQLYIDRVITRLGEGFSENSRLITPKAQERSILAIKKFATIIADYGIDKIRAVATSVVRESSNGREFVNEVQKETGISIEVISGEEEANLTVLGVLNSVSVNTDKCVIFDIGGGSTEYILIQNSDIASLTSTNLGVVRLTEEILINDTRQEMKSLSDFVQKTLRSKLNEFKFDCNSNMRLIATAGTPTTLAAIDLGLEEYSPELVNNFVLTNSKITSIVESLIRIPRNERIKITGMEKGREDIIITGAIILLETLDYFSASRVVVSDGGVLEGIAHSLIS